MAGTRPLEGKALAPDAWPEPPVMEPPVIDSRAERRPERRASVTGLALKPITQSTPSATVQWANRPALEEPGGGSLSHRARRQLRRGRIEPDAVLDLHGMTADRAHRVLQRFVADASRRGLRLLLVITGKGRAAGQEPWVTSREGGGLLRRAVPDWLAAPPLSEHVSDVATAFQTHGGTGAYYVHLRRRRGAKARADL